MIGMFRSAQERPDLTASFQRMSARQCLRLAMVIGGLLSASAHADLIDIVEGESIQAVIELASPGDEIVVHRGTYFENLDLMGKAITLRSTDPTDPEVVTATIIDGGGADRVLFCWNGEGPDTVISGFVITNGHSYEGGGMYNAASNPTVMNCTFIANSSSAYGGGMCNWGSNPTVINCNFTENTAPLGGGVYCTLSKPQIKDCSINRNSAGDKGGGLYVESAKYPTVKDCVISNNTPEQVYGPYIDGGGNSISHYPPPPFLPDTVGACCLLGGCIVVTEENCTAAGGEYLGDYSDCDSAACPESCPGDITGNGIVDVLDLLVVLSAWGPCQ